MWITALEAESRGRQEAKHVVFWGQGQVAFKSLSSHSHRQGLTWLLSCLLTSHFPVHMTEVKCLFSPCNSYSSMGQCWWPAVGMTQRDQRHRLGPGVGTTGLGKRQGLTPQPPNWAIAMAFQGGSWLETSCFFRKQCLQMNLRKKSVTWQIAFKGCWLQGSHAVSVGTGAMSLESLSALA